MILYLSVNQIEAGRHCSGSAEEISKARDEAFRADAIPAAEIGGGGEGGGRGRGRYWDGAEEISLVGDADPGDSGRW
ncbi:hypothetical protein [Oryza sativa Japonica Group]|jgi:hypothetical protein|uniref:Uncharacterized protein n=1 Tax=Oryza sativa subsp. japonica TaxID=39947 RepID=Q5VQE4_ORYSJ|nr:hypothetical protein [Oryza sativa Japonica Group]BAD68324.1 hypothetical protein [Oryza sativa Japonica Group]